MTNLEGHFATEPGGKPSALGRYVDVATVESIEMSPGLVFRPVLGERMMLNFVSFDKHTEAPIHVHEEEQIVLILSGEFEFNIDGEIRTLRVGDVAVVPSWVPHGARTLDTTCREVDVFNPPRRSLLDHARQQVRKLGDRRG